MAYLFVEASAEDFEDLGSSEGYSEMEAGFSFFEKAKTFLMEYESIHLFLDNDTAGQKCSALALKIDDKYVDESALYRNYKDLNEWIVLMGKQPKPPEPGDSF